ncbi:MAG: ABC transporter permease [Thermoguttaceae bacterium]|jgi:hypothetical protein|nr:ABC transporter permease [Thermoguttaceae bacterium]
MNPIAETTPVDGSQRAAPSGRWWQSIDRLTERLGDLLNPILVKEARQALKSRQFATVFGLLLVFIWGTSLVGLGIMGPDASYGAYGPNMFFAYYMALAAALLVIVPFSAFRSLAVEQEDRTYELLSITALGPRQIISGKLGSAAVQMIIYLSAISPCLAFTYMLRGIDFPTILFLLFWTILLSLGLSAVGLLLGTLTHQKHLQAGLSVAGVVGLLIAFGLVCTSTADLLFYGPLDFADPDFWLVNAILLTTYLSYFALVFYAAVAQITFASDNRSTRLRVIMLVQFLLATAWFGYGWFGPARREAELLFGYAVVAGIHWFAMGVFMTGESPDLSLRVRRGLPQSFLGRMFLTWFNPGPATGYVYAIGGALTAGILTLAALPYATTRWARIADVVPMFCAFGFCYLVIYLGVGLLILRVLRKFFPISVLASVLLHTIMIFFGCALPMILSELMPGWRGYNLLQFANFAWTLAEIVDQGSNFAYAGSLMVILPSVAAAVFALNVPGVIRELQYVRVAAPARVVEEDEALAAAVTPPRPPQPASPWD